MSLVRWWLGGLALVVSSFLGTGDVGVWGAEGTSNAGGTIISGRPLAEWVEMANQADSSTNVDAIVSALSEAVRMDEFSVKVTAADGLSVLGARAVAAIPALLDQLGHDQPWVREGAMGALAAMGKDAVPALIHTFQTATGGPRLRSGFVLGAIGADAKDAIPILAEARKTETPVVQERLAGILNQIDPQAFPGKRAASASAPAQIELNSAEVATGEGSSISSDWPQFHGPWRDAVCRERGLLQSWPAGGPRLLWTLTGLGRGLSTVSIADGRLFTMADRPSGVGQEEQQYVLAYDLVSRRQLWVAPVGAPFSTGPRCTPTVDGDLLYALGTEGDLVCLETATGKLRWRKSLVTDFGGKVMSDWKYCESPLVDGEHLICTPGAPDAMMAALDKNSGELIWKCAVPELGPRGLDGAAYSSAVIARIDGVRQYVQLVGRGVIGVDAQTGRFLWGYNDIANTVANVTAPLVRGRYVFATTAYNMGSALLEIRKEGDGFRAREVYFLGPKDFQNHHGGVVLVGDHIYGGHGSNRGEPTCVSLSTGEVRWHEAAPARGSAAVLYADGRLIFRYDRGEVLLVEAAADGFRIAGRFMPVMGDGPAWAHPVIHEGKLYLRHEDVLACYDLRAPK